MITGVHYVGQVVEDVLVKPERTLEVLDHLTDVMDACDHRSSVRRDFLWFVLGVR